MNNTLYKLLVVILGIFLFKNTSQAQKTAAYEMMVDGVKVIVQPSNNEIVQVQTVFKGGVQNYTEAKAGIEKLALNALTECGTANDDKNSFKNKLDKVSGRIYSNAGKDFSYVSLNCIKEDFDAVWALYTDALTQPLFNETEFNRIKQDAINSLKEQESEPDYALSKMASQTAFAGLHYAKDPAGSEAAVKSLTAEEVKNYYKTLATKSKMFLVVVADIDRPQLEEKVHALLSGLPQGEPFAFKKQSFSAKGNTFKSDKKEFATNYIQAVAGGPAPGSADYNAFLIAMRVFYDRHFLEVRTNNGLSYAPYTYFDGGLTPSANIVVSTTDPNKYKAVLNQLIAKTRRGFTEDEVKNMKTSYITREYYKQETNEAQASSLAANEVLHNNWKRAITLNEELKKVTAKDVTAAFNKYLTNFTWVYLGDPTKVDPAMYTQAATKPTLPPSSLQKKKVN